MKKYILIINPSTLDEEFYTYDSLSEMLVVWGFNNLNDFKSKFKCIICESLVLF